MNVKRLSNACYLAACPECEFSFLGHPFPWMGLQGREKETGALMVALCRSTRQRQGSCSPVSLFRCLLAQCSSHDWSFNWLSFGFSCLLYPHAMACKHLGLFQVMSMHARGSGYRREMWPELSSPCGLGLALMTMFPENHT